MAIIEFQNTKKYFGNVEAVNGISLKIEKGEIFGFLGPNGAGKTTTISLMLDFLKPTAGEVILNGLKVSENSTELKRNIGYIPADVHFYENMTIQKHFELITTLKGKTKYLTDLIDDFDLNPKKKPKELSTGNRQKFAIILALMHGPEILIMDEPTRGLDPLYQNVFYKWLKKLNREGSTVFMSSHNLFEVENICNRVAVIKKGKVVALEDVKTLRNKRMHLVEIEFLEKFNSSDFKESKWEIIEKMDYHLKLKVAGDINLLLKTLTKYQVKDLLIERAGLEEIFLEYYQD